MRRAPWPATVAALAALAVCAPAVAAPGSPGGAADILIVERPRALVLFDVYQQRIGEREASAFPPFVPITLLREHDVMGDGFTPCAAVAIGGTAYYLQKEASGTFSTTGPAGATAVLRGVTLCEDTVVLLHGEALRLRVPLSKEEIRLAPGTWAFRAFVSKSEAYVRVASPADRFGWVDLLPGTRGTDWRIEPAAAPVPLADAEILRRVRSVTDGANLTLARIYRSLSPGSAPVPSFRVARSAREIECELVPAALAREFSGSLIALVPPIERALGGTGLHPAIAGSAIHIPLP